MTRKPPPKKKPQPKLVVAKVGRPTAYREDYPDRLLAHMERGLSFESFAGTVGVCETTIKNWLTAHPEFMTAKKRGQSASRLLWEQMGLEHARLPGSMFNTTMWIFTMKCRFGWRDSDPTIPVEQDSEAAAMEREERQARIAELQKKLAGGGNAS